MALKNKTLNYIKLNQNTSINTEIYVNEVSRKLEKKALKRDIYKNIFETYETLLKDRLDKIDEFIKNNKIDIFKTEIYENLSQRYPELFNLMIEAEEIKGEYAIFKSDLEHKTGPIHQYPLIKEYFPDIEDLIPEVLFSGYVDISGESLSEMYENAKTNQIFGVTADC